MSRVLGVIPARFGSTRFPGKPLAPLAGRTLIEEVWRRATAAAQLERVVIATDDVRIADAARRFGAETLLTSDRHPSGTDRVAEVLQRLGERYAAVVNIQGDEPLVTGSSLDRLIETLGSGAPIATLAEPLTEVGDLFDPNVVKVVRAADGRALYFSRSPIPFHRGSVTAPGADFRDALARRPEGLAGYLKHQGIYAYSRDTLLALTRIAPSPLELDEGLEQLRALEAGYEIRVVDSDFRSQSVDTPADLERVARALSRTETC